MSYTHFAFYIRRQLLAAEAHLLLKEYAQARKSVDKALSTILAIQNGEANAWQVSRWLLGAIRIYSELKDYSTALGLYVASVDLIGQSFAQNSPDAVAFHMLGESLSFEAGHYKATAYHADALITTLNRNETDVSFKSIYRSQALATKAAACFFLEDLGCVKSAVVDPDFDSLIRSFNGEISDVSQIAAGQFLAVKLAIPGLDTTAELPHDAQLPPRPYSSDA